MLNALAKNESFNSPETTNIQIEISPSVVPPQKIEYAAFTASAVIKFLKTTENRAQFDELRKLSQVSAARTVASLTFHWGTIALAFGLALLVHEAWSFLIAFIVIASQQHALGILVHDATHFRLFKNATWNDAICDLFCALPINMLTSRYRFEHILHHRYNPTMEDPYWQDWAADKDWHWPKPKRSAYWLFFRDLLVINSKGFGQVLWRWSPWCNHFGRRPLPSPLTRAERVRVYSFMLVIFGAVTATHAWLPFLLLWVLPGMTLTLMFVRIRSIAEHLALPNEHDFNSSRHVHGTRLERWLLAPHNINYHLAHHLFPSVPWYNLIALHRLLLSYPPYRTEAKIYETYFGGDRSVFRELMT